MGRDEYLRQREEREEALRKLNQKYMYPSSITYDIPTKSGLIYHLEYRPAYGTLKLCGAEIPGCLLKPLRDVLNKILDE